MARNFGRGGSGLSFFIRRDAWQTKYFLPRWLLVWVGQYWMIYNDFNIWRSLVLSSGMYSPSRHSKEEQSRIMRFWRMQASKTS